MKNSLRKIMSLALAVVMVFSLLVPVTSVLADDAVPMLTMSIVNGEGDSASPVSTATDLYLRISVTGTADFIDAGFKIVNLVGLQFDTDREPKPVFDEEVFVGRIMPEDNIIFNTTEAYANLAKDSSDKNAPAAIENMTTKDSYELVDFPIKVTATDGGAAISATFLDATTVLTTKSGKVIKGDIMDPLTTSELSATIPYTLTGVTLTGTKYTTPATNATNIADTIKASLVANNKITANKGETAVEYSIYTTAPSGEGAPTAYALIESVDAVNAMAAGTYKVTFKIVDSAIVDGELVTELDAVIITAADEKINEGVYTLTVNTDVAATLDAEEVAGDKSATAAKAVDSVKAAIAADNGLVKVLMTDGNYANKAGDGVYTVTATAGNVDLTAGTVTVTITPVDTAYKFNGTDVFATVTVSLGKWIAVDGMFVVADTEGTIDVDGTKYTEVAIPSIKAYAYDLLSEAEKEDEIWKMKWSNYSYLVDFKDAEGGEKTKTVVYNYAATGTGYNVVNWVDYDESVAPSSDERQGKGEQDITVNVTDSSKENFGETTFAYTAAEEAAIIDNTDNAYVLEMLPAAVSVKYNTTSADALNTLVDAIAFTAYRMDGETMAVPADVTVDVSAAITIADYDGATKDTYVATVDSSKIVVTSTIADEAAKYAVVADAELTVRVKAKATGGVSAGTVVGGGGVQGGSKKDDVEEDKKDEAKPGTPIPEDHWAVEIVEDLTEAGVIDGKAETVESLDTTLTREEAAKIFALALGLELTAPAAEYTDADEIAADYVKYVDACTEAGIFEGHDDGSFDPKGALTREQVAAVVIRAYGFGEGTAEITFADADLITWAKGYVSKAVELEIVNGYSVDNTFRPLNSITRGEAFAIVSRAMNLKNALDAAVAE